MQNDIPPGTKVKKKTYRLDVMIDTEQTEPSYSDLFYDVRFFKFRCKYVLFYSKN